MKKGFTLAEIMIVLSVIAVVIVILIPVAKNAMVNDKVMKFKKGHEVLYNTFSELVNSDKYYLNGDLGVRINGDLLDRSHEGDTTYLCVTFSDLIKTKSVNCKEYGSSTVYVSARTPAVFDVWCRDLQRNFCRARSISKIISIDGISFFEANSYMSFGSSILDSIYRHYTDTNSKGFCMDIDEWCKGEDPFGYGIRVDGKILNGARADEWLEKSIQDKD